MLMTLEMPNLRFRLCLYIPGIPAPVPHKVLWLITALPVSN